jgi:hypothetical protein
MPKLFGNRMLSTVLGPKGDKIIEGWRKPVAHKVFGNPEEWQHPLLEVATKKRQ